MKSDRKRSCRKLACQSLETRRLLAGDVAADLAAGLPATDAESANVVEIVNPPETQCHARKSDRVGQSPGAHERPGMGWKGGADVAVAERMEPVAVDLAMVAEDSEDPILPAVDAMPGPAPNAGDGIPDGSGFDTLPGSVGDGELFGPAPNSGDGNPDGSGLVAPHKRG
ncbi:hypothetical protein [Novipirellula artificiosorum]|uniref:Planctomycete extracellular domain-containing protein n=1 Tax=Novipirellula artificiosorum TaxID=2528016 RepID=A0A5C6E3U0_9BACT|nr:hypothetical protein [Novipirellula artificiosorum]TWU42647.1 hypothetical protein Poly41_09460 [Novipirellula artificiosorum]